MKRREGQNNSMQSIGPILKNRRQSLNMSLKDIEKITKIRVRYLQAIENDDYSILPAPVYARGFIRVYARTLGVDPKYIMDIYAQSQGEEVLGYEGEERSLEVEVDEERRHLAEPRSRMRRRASERDVYSKRRMFFGALALIIFIALTIMFGNFVLGLFNSNRSADNSEKSSESFSIDEANSLRESEQQAETTETPILDQTAPIEGEGALPADETSTGFTLEVKATERVWIKVTLDGTVVYEDTMEKGIVKNWEAKLNAKVRSGNGELVLIKKDGVDLGKLGVGLEEKTFTK